MNANIVNTTVNSTITLNGITRTLAEIEWAKKFVFESNFYEGKAKSVTYKKGSLIASGEGGNRHLFLSVPTNIDRLANLKRGYEERYGDTHIWVDTHCAQGQCFISSRKDTPTPFFKWAHKQDDYFLYLSHDELAFAILDVIDNLS